MKYRSSMTTTTGNPKAVRAAAEARAAFGSENVSEFIQESAA